MADINALIASGGPTPPNPLTTIQGYQNLANSVQQNKLLQAQLPLVQQQTANAQLQNQTGQQSLSNTMTNNFNQKLAAVATLPDSQVAPYAQKLLVDGVNSGLIDPQHASMYSNIIGSGNVSQIRQMGLTGLVGSLAGPDAVKALYGEPGSMVNGQTAQPGVYNGVLNPNNPGAFTPSGQATQLQPQPTWQQNYNPANRTTTQQPSPALGANTGAPAPGAGPAPAIPGNGSYRAPGVPAASNGPQYNASPPMGTPESVQANIAAYNGDAAKVPDTMDRIRNNQIALEAFQLAKTGKGTQDYYNLGQKLQSWGLVPDGSAWSQQINSQALATKYTAMAIANSPLARSDASLAEVAKGSASESVPNPVAQSVIKTNIARDRMFAAQVNETADPTKYVTEQAGKFPINTDRRAFEWDLMTPEGQANLKTQLAQSPNDQAKFAKSLGIAQRLFFPNYGQQPQPSQTTQPAPASSGQ